MRDHYGPTQALAKACGFKTSTKALDNFRGQCLAADKLQKQLDEVAAKRADPQHTEYMNQTGPPFRSMSAFREEFTEELNFIKRKMQGHALRSYQFARPEADRFLVAASEHLDRLQSEEQERHESFGLDEYQPSQTILQLRRVLEIIAHAFTSLQNRDPTTFPYRLRPYDLMPWIPDYTKGVELYVPAPPPPAEAVEAAKAAAEAAAAEEAAEQKRAKQRKAEEERQAKAREQAHADLAAHSKAKK